MASFVYTQYLKQLQAGSFAVPIGSWLSYHLALVLNTYVPNKNSDTVFSDIPGGDVAADGKTGTFPTFTVALNGTGSGVNEIGLRESGISSNIWAAVPSAANPVNALVLYAIEDVSHTILIAYFDNWGGSASRQMERM